MIDSLNINDSHIHILIDELYIYYNCIEFTLDLFNFFYNKNTLNSFNSIQC